MAKSSSTKTALQDANATDVIGHYAEALTPGQAEICATLRKEIEATLPKATSRIWHGSPVWFIGEHPVVGYNGSAKDTVTLLFWNGQSFEEPDLKATGKFKAAHIRFAIASDVDLKSLRRWLKKAATLIWNYEGIPQSRRPKSR
jgi:hypothetical protein